MKFKPDDLVWVKYLPASKKEVRAMCGPALVTAMHPGAERYAIQFIGDDTFEYYAEEKHVRPLKRKEAQVVSFIVYIKPVNMKGVSPWELRKITDRLMRFK